MNLEVEEAVVDAKLKLDDRSAPGAFDSWRDGIRHAIYLLLVAVAAIAISGYHPYDEDAGIYVAGIKQALHPGLYGSSAAFITPYFRMSLFSDCNAWIVRALNMPLDYVLFTMQILTFWLLLYACWELAGRCFERNEERWGAVLLVAVCLSVPVAGSSLFLMDPYLTGRSFSTPLTLLALCSCLDGRAIRTALLLALVGLFHPLMAIYATGFVLLLWAVRRNSLTGIAVVVASAMAAAETVQCSQRTVVESAAYLAAVVTRYYFFLYRWRWYELVGVIAPLVLLAVFVRWRGHSAAGQSVPLAKTCVVAGVVAIAVSLLFARPSSHSHLMSALQPIRPFLCIYFCMFLLLGGVLGRFLLGRVRWRWAVFYLGLSAGMMFAQHQAYKASAQVELPWATNTNGWNRAFVWIRDRTPADAVVALDADYIHASGEDGQGFRAIAERSSLADLSKDGGAAAAFPTLAERWMQEQTATTGLSRLGDPGLRRRLEPFSVTWVVLDASARTAMPCPFADETVKVCQLQ